MKLVLFFTYGNSLTTWLDSGLLDREKLIYEEHLTQKTVSKIYWMTYGVNDAEIARQLIYQKQLNPNIQVLGMPQLFKGRIGRLLYSLIMPFYYKKILKSADILKTNQMMGSWTAIIAGKIWKKPVVVRTGYTLTLYAKRSHYSINKIKLYQLVERFSFRHANYGFVSSELDKKYIISKYNVPEKIRIIYNYIDTSLFYPSEEKQFEDDRIIFIGRLEYEKNLFNLIESVVKIGLTLDIYGQGSLQKQLEALAHKLDAKVNFMGYLPNNKIAQKLQRYRLFILPSLYEGMPKTLLEAMACGLVCIGTNVSGIQEVIQDGINGYLANGTGVSSITDTIYRVKNASIQEKELIKKNAIETIHNQFTLKSVWHKEYALFKSLTKKL